MGPSGGEPIGPIRRRMNGAHPAENVCGPSSGESFNFRAMKKKEEVPKLEGDEICGRGTDMSWSRQACGMIRDAAVCIVVPKAD